MSSLLINFLTALAIPIVLILIFVAIAKMNNTRPGTTPTGVIPFYKSWWFLPAFIIVGVVAYNTVTVSASMLVFTLASAVIGFGGFLLYKKIDTGKWLITVGIGLVLAQVGISWLGEQNVSRIGNRLGSYLADSNNGNIQTGVTQETCGPGKFTEGRIESTTIPLRLKRIFPCKANLYASVGVSILVRYNGRGEWKLWEVTPSSGPPIAEETIRFVEVILKNPGRSSLVTLRHDW